MSSQRSCLVDKLSYYVRLGDGDLGLVRSLEKAEESYASGVDIYRGGDATKRLWVVKSGWLFSATDLPDGRRQIVRIHHPGDVIGFPDIAFENATTNLTAAEPVTLCPFPKKDLDVIFQQSPLLTALLFTLALRDQVVLIDHIRALGRMSAEEKVAFFLLDLAARLRIVNPGMSDTFRLPLNQSEIGDALGLTNVYVSRTFGMLERRGLVARSNGFVRLIDEAALAESCDFIDRYAGMDTSWFPPG